MWNLFKHSAVGAGLIVIVTLLAGGMSIYESWLQTWQKSEFLIHGTQCLTVFLFVADAIMVIGFIGFAAFRLVNEYWFQLADVVSARRAARSIASRTALDGDVLRATERILAIALDTAIKPCLVTFSTEEYWKTALDRWGNEMLDRAFREHAGVSLKRVFTEENLRDLMAAKAEQILRTEWDKTQNSQPVTLSPGNDVKGVPV